MTREEAIMRGTNFLTEDWRYRRTVRRVRTRGKNRGLPVEGLEEGVLRSIGRGAKKYWRNVSGSRVRNLEKRGERLKGLSSKHYQSSRAAQQAGDEVRASNQYYKGARASHAHMRNVDKLDTARKSRFRTRAVTGAGTGSGVVGISAVSSKGGNKPVTETRFESLPLDRQRGEPSNEIIQRYVDKHYTDELSKEQFWKEREAHLSREYDLQAVATRKALQRRHAKAAGVSRKGRFYQRNYPRPGNKALGITGDSSPIIFDPSAIPPHRRHNRMAMHPTRKKETGPMSEGASFSREEYERMVKHIKDTHRGRKLSKAEVNRRVYDNLHSLLNR